MASCRGDKTLASLGPENVYFTRYAGSFLRCRSTSTGTLQGGTSRARQQRGHCGAKVRATEPLRTASLMPAAPHTGRDLLGTGLSEAAAEPWRARASCSASTGCFSCSSCRQGASKAGGERQRERRESLHGGRGPLAEAGKPRGGIDTGTIRRWAKDVGEERLLGNAHSHRR